ncbi:hypothetical protein Msil_1450 [Methylocella silvestris BL2]|uniref:Uncharacterized protein n=1 Tax=Methylocella silvestris (strain DSM 15510 / CIP 108128 / LMG 27833 / NCIMB 13906 / BL2) TaxID=395965 RepID=B8ESS9_METSB|nr:hypothetical protein [Methylocella silvestris]ACK50414.1 hypothetical protein Msil_1450 [Methylocella silvestris BL2]
MKHSPKPFAVEIKKSRRAPALPLEPVPKERLDFGGPTQAPLEKDRSAASPMSGDDFAIPAFLQSDKPAPRPAADSWSKEAEQLFGPKPVAATSQEPVEARARPRILQSLIPAESPMTAPSNNASAAATRAAQAKTETPRPRREAAQDERANQERGPARRSKIESFADAEAPRKAAGVEVQGELSLGVKRQPKRRRPAASAPLPAPRESQPAPTRSFAKTPAQDVKDHADGPPRVSLARLGRDDAAALPRGQHWKRRLHPRAW